MLPNIAFILDGVPSDTMLTLYWLRCILVPLFVILFSEIVVLHCRKPFPTLIALCAVAAVVVLRPAYNLIDWGYPFFPPWQFVAAPWIGALSPFVVVGYFAIRQKRRLSTSENSLGFSAERRVLYVAHAVSLIGLGWLFFRYLWILIGSDTRLLMGWSIATVLCCAVMILAIRRFTSAAKKSNSDGPV